MRAPTGLTELPERNLDVLRAVAVLAVLVSHTVRYWTDTIGPLSVFPLGRMGVLLFFVHTSLVLMGSLERGVRGGLSERRLALDFYVRRAFRIYPLAVLTVLFVALLRIPANLELHAADPLSLRLLVANLTLTQNVLVGKNILGPLWSLPLEVQMYVVLPLCFWVASRGSTRSVIVLLVTGLLLATAQLVGSSVVPALARLEVLGYAPCFLAGVAAYRLLRSPRAVLPAASWLPLLLLILWVYPQAMPNLKRTFWSAWLLSLTVGLLIPYVRELSPSALTRVAKWIATYSYGIYLTHIPILFLLAGPYSRGLRPWRLVLALAAVGAASVVLYHGIERPLIRFGGRVAGHLSGARPKLASTVPATPEAA